MCFYNITFFTASELCFALSRALQVSSQSRHLAFSLCSPLSSPQSPKHSPARALFLKCKPNHNATLYKIFQCHPKRFGKILIFKYGIESTCFFSTVYIQPPLSHTPAYPDALDQLQSLTRFSTFTALRPLNMLLPQLGEFFPSFTSSALKFCIISFQKHTLVSPFGFHFPFCALLSTFPVLSLSFLFPGTHCETMSSCGHRGKSTIWGIRRVNLYSQPCCQLSVPPETNQE